MFRSWAGHGGPEQPQRWSSAACYWALTVMCGAMFAFAAMNLAFRALGPPVDLVLLAPASGVAALTTAVRGPVRIALGLLAVALLLNDVPEGEKVSPA